MLTQRVEDGGAVAQTRYGQTRGKSDAIRREHKSHNLAHFHAMPAVRRIQINQDNGRLRI